MSQHIGIAACSAEGAALCYRTVCVAMEGPVYPKELARPTLAEREEINRIIMDELVRGELKPAAVAYFQGVFRPSTRRACSRARPCAARWRVSKSAFPGRHCHERRMLAATTDTQMNR